MLRAAVPRWTVPTALRRNIVPLPIEGALPVDVQAMLTDDLLPPAPRHSRLYWNLPQVWRLTEFGGFATDFSYVDSSCPAPNQKSQDEMKLDGVEKLPVPEEITEFRKRLILA